MGTFDRALILETSGKVGQVALASGSTVLAEARLADDKRRSSDLAATVARLLEAQKWKARELTAVIVGLGPGSYTGLRVGLASAKALAYAVNCELFGVETFAAIAQLAPHSHSIVVVADALQGKVFHRRYAKEGDLSPASELSILDRAACLDTIEPEDLITGPGAHLLDLTAQHRVAEVREREPQPLGLLLAAQRSPWACVRDVWTAEPFYLRGSSAEEVFARRSSAAKG